MTAELPLKNSATIIWAQRLDRLFLTVELQDLTIEELKCQGNHFHIKGQNQEAKYDIDLELFDEVKEEYKQIDSSRHVVLEIRKVKDEWWPRLTKDAKKIQWVKVDFEKWVDEDELNEEDAENDPFANYMNGGGLPSNFQFPGSGGMGDLNLDDVSDEEDAQEEEEEDSEKPGPSSK